MAKKMTRREELEGLIEEIEALSKKNNWETFQTQTGTFHVVEKNDHSFHLYFIYNDGVYKEKTFDEIFYDLKDRIVWLKRNEKELQFSEDNIRKSFGYMRKEDIGFLESKDNEGMLQTCYSYLGKMYSENVAMVSRFLVRLMFDYPVLENIHKAGLNIQSCFNEIKDAKTMDLKTAFGFDRKSQLKLYRIGSERENVKYPKFPARFVRDLTDEQIQQMFKYISWVEEFDSKYGLRKEKEILNYCISSWGKYEESTMRNFFAYIKQKETDRTIDEKRLIEYLFYELDVRQGIESGSGAMRLYQDYINMASSLGSHYERYPKSLKLRHDISMKYYHLMSNVGEGFAKSCESVKYLEGKIGKTGYSIVVPSSPEEIVDEGEQLSHCVKSYIEAINNGECQIIFLRKSKTPEVALYTVEVRKNAIVQFAGNQNCEPDDEARAAIDKLSEAYNLIQEWDGKTT